MMKTIKLELSVKLLMGAIALGLFLNVFKDFPPSANANHGHQIMKVAICEFNSPYVCAGVRGYGALQVDAD